MAVKNLFMIFRIELDCRLFDGGAGVARDGRSER
jgi:hypothetical protein